ncbi:MAG: glutamate racemase [Flavobacteriales bacterium]|nr:glutamate racemase [Flavobacteriales bacterium]
MSLSPIGVFDSGFGGLTVLREMVTALPQYDYLYLGDNARTPYGTRSFETVYHYTLECVTYLFDQGCPLVIVACNTASAKALRTIQQRDLPKMRAGLRVLGVIRPTAEVIGNSTRTGHVGVLGTSGTVASESYPIEIGKFFPDVSVHQQACPLWVPLIENNEHQGDGADFFIQKYLDELIAQSSSIDTILLGCTHYPLLMEKIKAHVAKEVTIIPQGKIVADSLTDYLSRHAEMESKLSRNGTRNFLTTDDAAAFDSKARIFYGAGVASRHIAL